VPSRQRVRADQEAPPPVPGQDPGHRRWERPIGRGEEDSPAASTTEDLQLGWRSTAFSRSSSSRPHRTSRRSRPQAEGPVPDGPGHPGESDGRWASWRTGRSECRSSFLYPHRPLATRELGSDALAGKPVGLSPAAYCPSLSQRPTSQAVVTIAAAVRGAVLLRFAVIRFPDIDRSCISEHCSAGTKGGFGEHSCPSFVTRGNARSCWKRDHRGRPRPQSVSHPWPLPRRMRSGDLITARAREPFSSSSLWSPRQRVS